MLRESSERVSISTVALPSVGELGGERAHDGEPCAPVGEREGGPQLFAAHVVEDRVDAVRGGRAQLLLDGTRAADHHRVIAEFLDQPVRLLLGARAADDPGGAAQPGDLARQGAHAARRSGDEDRVAGAYFGAAHHPHPGGGPLGEVGGRVGQQAGVEPLHLVGVHHGVLAPAEAVFHQVAGLEVGPRGGDHLADGGPVQRLADLVGGHRHHAGLVHQRAHHGGDTHHGVADQHLAGPGFRDRHLHDLEEVIGDGPLGPGGEADFAVCALSSYPRG